MAVLTMSQNMSLGSISCIDVTTLMHIDAVTEQNCGCTVNDKEN